MNIHSSSRWKFVSVARALSPVQYANPRLSGEGWRALLCYRMQHHGIGPYLGWNELKIDGCNEKSWPTWIRHYARRARHFKVKAGSPSSRRWTQSISIHRTLMSERNIQPANFLVNHRHPLESSSNASKLTSLILIYFTDVDHSGREIQTPSKRRCKFAVIGPAPAEPPDVSKQFISN